jgi:hypothetical protein
MDDWIEKLVGAIAGAHAGVGGEVLAELTLLLAGQMSERRITDGELRRIADSLLEVLGGRAESDGETANED